ncbi:DUF4402 domain-containing protein [Gillisia sp. M10.2A]|uniref:DUF4402 domain-containing protein n=1 Tax=Gillisia lutea TaxID=2909668 RepID=A0ABS9EJB0_9FLAO|nr:DUF4402 domain-containing protein [Gillisia lutea]MCF4101536.1 DUF4402 domain-containing protein [Gillisia lutea]
MYLKHYLLSFFFLLCYNLYSQVSATSTVESRATIIDPIKIEKTIDLDFGNVISGYTPGSVVLTPDGTRTANGVMISNSFAGTVSAAEAVVTHGNNSYAITLPTSFTLYNQENQNQILVIDQFQVMPLLNSGVDGEDILKIGATLNLEANQIPGYYTNTGGFNVTVSYN